MNEFVKRRERHKAQQLWLLLAIFALAALLRIGLSGQQCLWADEVFSLAVATGHSLEHSVTVADPARGDFVEPDRPLPAEEFRRYLEHESPLASPARVVRAVLLSDTSPPLYYLLLYGWTIVFGTSDIALRLFSAIIALACFPLLAAIARRTGGKGAVLPACVLFALSPLAIYYSMEVRMYSLLWLCVLTTTWASLMLTQRGGKVGLYALWILASAAGFLTHYFFIFPWLAIVALLVIRPAKLTRQGLFCCVLLTAIILLPWYIRLPESLDTWRITEGWLNWRPAHFNRLTAFLKLVLQPFSGQEQHLWPGNRISSIAALLLFALVFVAMAWRLRRHLFAWRTVLLWLLFAVACVGPLVFDLVRHTYTVDVPRYAIAALPAAYLLAGMGLACLRLKVRILLLVFIIFAWSPNIWSVLRSRSRSGSSICDLAYSANANGSPSDLILIHSIPSGVLGMARYANGPAALASWVGQLGTRHVPDSINTLIAGRARVVLVRVHEVGEPAPEEDWLRANATVAGERRSGSGRIIDFRSSKSPTF